MPTYFTPIVASPNQAADADTFNDPMLELDAGIGIAYARGDDALSIATANNSELVAARSSYASLDARLDVIENITVVAGGNVVTTANGAASAGQKTVTVVSTTGFVAGASVEYLLNGTTLEYNTVDVVTDSTHLLLDNNIGTGGILSGGLVSLISTGIPMAANAIPHGSTDLTLPQTIEFVSGGRFNVRSYGASPSASQSANTAAFNAAITAAKVAGGTVEIPAGTYAYDGCLDLCDTTNVHLVGTGGHYKTILECHNTGKAAVECIGSKQIKIENIRIVGHATDTPTVGIWTARSTGVTGNDTSQVWFERVAVDGAFTVAAWYNNGCESVQLFGCHAYIINAACKAGVMHDWENTAGTGDTANALTPEHATLRIESAQVLGLISHSFLTCDPAAVAFSPVRIINETGAVQLRSTYVTAYGAPIYYMLGGGVLEVYNDYIEGTPTYIVHGDYRSGKTNNFTFLLSGCNETSAAASSGSALWFDDLTTVLNSLIERSSFANNLRFYNIYESRIEHWNNYSDSVNPALVITNESVNCLFEIGNADTYTNAGPKNTTVVYNSDVYGGYTLFPGLAVNINAIPGATAQAIVTRILIGSKSWSPGEIADDAQASTTLTISGVTAADEWFCVAHFAGITSGAWEISAYALDGGAAVVITNRTGGSVTPTGTLHVTAWKITAAA
jgi:hypothetical protein